MGEPKLYGIERADGTVIQEYGSIGPASLASTQFVERGHRVVSVAAVSAEKYARLLAVVRAADRMRAFRQTTQPGDLANGAVKEEWTKLIRAYDTQRAALGEIVEG